MNLLERLSRVIIVTGIFFLSTALGCDETDPDPSIDPEFDIQGHRGFRGLYPENSLLGFIKAVDIGVTTLEMDIVVSKDSQLVVSHEPTFSADICSHPDGSPISEAAEDTLNLYQLDLGEIQNYDCGLRGNTSFPDQAKVASVKPTLASVIDSVEAHVKRLSLDPIRYNIEIKSSLAGDNIKHPEPDRFVELLLGLIDSLGVKPRVSVQSFDVRSLQELRQQDANVQTAFLLSDGDLSDNLSILGFTPDTYSPAYTSVSEFMIAQASDRRMKLVPWTVNDRDQMKALIDLKVDGIITDFPDRLISLIESNF